jgi:hypothetical protein
LFTPPPVPTEAASREEMNTSEEGDSDLPSVVNNTGLTSQQETSFVVSHSINLLLSFPTNVYVLWLIMTRAGGTMTSEFFALNLTMSEIIVSLFDVLSLVSFYLPKVPLWCAAQFFSGFLIGARPLFQCCVCVERYLAVVHPVVYLKYKPLRYRVGITGLVWLVVIGFCLSTMFMGFFAPYFRLAMSAYIVILLVMSFCCLSVLWALKRPRPGDGEKEVTNNMKMRAFKIILINLIVLVMNYLPMLLVAALYGHLGSRLHQALIVSLTVAVVTGFMQPLLYLHRAGKLPCIRGL